MNSLGLVAAITTFLSIWAGHVLVRKLEYDSGSLFVPASGFALIGIFLLAGSFLSGSLVISSALGILSVTALWDSFEFFRQEKRVIKGHAPANPSNPRHIRILAQYPTATTNDLLKRDPVGRRVSAEEAIRLVAGRGEMMLNTFGFFAGLVTLLVIGLGFVWVIRGERILGYLWWPYFMGSGILLVIVSLFIGNEWYSLMTGVVGGLLVWGSTEFKEQAIRAELGWFPFNGKKIPPPFAGRIEKIKTPHL